MRVIGGRFKGRRLSSFKGASIRPTSDKVREAIYNILPREFPYTRVLDLFAGTGAMGIEALSRGAVDATFVDSDAGAVSLIKKNIEACGDAARILRGDVIREIKRLSRNGEGFGLIIIDPPYNSTLLEEALSVIDASGLLVAGGVVIAETSKRNPVKGGFASLKLFDERKYGDTLVYFFTRQ